MHMDVGRPIQIGNLISVAGLVFGFGGFIEGLNPGPNRSSLTEDLVVVSVFLVLLGAVIVALASDSSRSSGTAPTDAGAKAPGSETQLKRRLGGYIVTILVAVVLVAIGLVLSFVPVGHEVQVSRSLDVQFEAANP